jgi:hypothetical protein
VQKSEDFSWVNCTNSRSIGSGTVAFQKPSELFSSQAASVPASRPADLAFCPHIQVSHHALPGKACERDPFRMNVLDKTEHYKKITVQNPL